MCKLSAYVADPEYAQETLKNITRPKKLRTQKSEFVEHRICINFLYLWNTYIILVRCLKMLKQCASPHKLSFIFL